MRRAVARVRVRFCLPSVVSGFVSEFDSRVSVKRGSVQIFRSKHNSHSERRRRRGCSLSTLRFRVAPDEGGATGRQAPHRDAVFSLPNPLSRYDGSSVVNSFAITNMESVRLFSFGLLKYLEFAGAARTSWAH